MTATLTMARLQELLAACRPLRIAVIGDFNLDAYWYADMALAELSREAPLYNRPVVRETYTPGGAANVAWNLADLGVGKVYALTVLGQDWRYDLLAGALSAAGVCMDFVQTWPGRLTPLFGKVMLQARGLQQEDARLDFVNVKPLAVEAEEELLATLERLLPELDGLVVADYHADGLISPAVRAALSALAAAHERPVCVVDSRSHIGGFSGMVLKPNRLEAAAILCPGPDPASVPLADLIAAGRRLQAENGRPLYITLGSEGCLVLAGGEPLTLPTRPAPPPCDPVGAGDTFLSALTAGLAAGAAPWEAGALANLASGVTVRKLHVTGTATPDEILARYQAGQGEVA